MPIGTMTPKKICHKALGNYDTLKKLKKTPDIRNFRPGHSKTFEVTYNSEKI